MPRGRKTDALSSEGQQVMVAGFRSRTPSGIIANQILAATGEKSSERTIARAKSEWEANQQRRKAGREQMEDLLAASREGNHTASEMVNALAIEALMRDPDGFAVLNPIDVQRTSLAAEKVRLQREQIELKRREIALQEKKFEVMERQRQAVEKAALELENKAASGKTVTAEELRKVREIYGLSA